MLENLKTHKQKLKYLKSIVIGHVHIKRLHIQTLTYFSVVGVCSTSIFISEFQINSIKLKEISEV